MPVAAARCRCPLPLPVAVARRLLLPAFLPAGVLTYVPREVATTSTLSDRDNDVPPDVLAKYNQSKIMIQFSNNRVQNVRTCFFRPVK